MTTLPPLICTLVIFQIYICVHNYAKLDVHSTPEYVLNV